VGRNENEKVFIIFYEGFGRAKDDALVGLPIPDSHKARAVSGM
jgi:hypothetical protein